MANGSIVSGGMVDERVERREAKKNPLSTVFETPPVTLDEFVTGSGYLNNPRLSDVQYGAVRHLEQIYLPETYPEMVEAYGDYWNPVRLVNFCVCQWGKGSGKDHICRIAVARWIYLLMCLKSPQAYFGMPAQETIHVLNVASSATQASRVFFTPFRRMIMAAPCFKGTFAMMQGNEPGKYAIEFPGKNLECVSGHSGSEAQEGMNLIGGIADEISAFKTEAEAVQSARQSGREPTKTAESIVKMMRSSARTRFARSFKLALISYPRYCVSVDTPVLCADLEWRTAGKLAEGDKIVAFDEKLTGSRYRTAEITYADRVMKPSMRVITDQGEVVASRDHPWAVRWNRGTGAYREWRNTEDLRPGDEIMFFAKPWERDESWDAGYVAGAYDGEGSLGVRSLVGKPGTRAALSLSQVPGKELLEFVEAWCESNGFTTSRYDFRPVAAMEIRGGVPELMRFLGTVRPKRLMREAHRLWEGRPLANRSMGRAIVQSVEDVGDVEVASLTTSTGTFIANGMLAHNTGDAIQQYTQRAVDDNEKYGVEDPIVEGHARSKWYVSGPLATWDVNPRVTGKADFEDDYESDQADAEAKYECRPGKATNRFFRNTVALADAFSVDIVEPVRIGYYWGQSEEEENLEGPLAPAEKDGWQVRFDFAGLYPMRGATYALHADMSLNGDRAGIAMAHVQNFEQAEHTTAFSEQIFEPRPIVKIDFVTAFEADLAELPEPREVQLRWFRKLVWILAARGFVIGSVTMDGWQSLDSLQILAARGIEAKRLSCDVPQTPVWGTLKDVMYDGRLKGYRHPLLSLELASLMKLPNGKLDHPSGGSKDLADAVSAAVTGAVEVGGSEGDNPERADQGVVEIFQTVGWGSTPNGGTMMPEGMKHSAMDRPDLSPPRL